jgi:hypothetical protein
MSGREDILAVLAVILLALVTRGSHARDRTGRCRSGKVQFDRKADADRVVYRSQAERREGYDRRLARSYRCPDCGRWHTTSQRPRVLGDKPQQVGGRVRPRGGSHSLVLERSPLDHVAGRQRARVDRPARAPATRAPWTDFEIAP